jgi:SAM-dependent methyltransferase
VGVGREPRLATVEGKLIYILVYFKGYPTFDLAGLLFDLNRSQANRWMHRLQPVLAAALGQHLALPKRKLTSMAEFVEAFPDVDRLHRLDQTSHILDCGVFTGVFSLALLDSIDQPVHVSGVDISYPMLTHAQPMLEYRCPTLDFRWGDIRHLPFADVSFDAVIFAHVLEHLADPVKTLRERVRVLQPGVPLIDLVTRQGIGKLLLSLRWHNRGYAANHLDACLQAAGLEAVRSFDYGTSWSKWMCIAVIEVKPGSAIAQIHPR